MPMARIAVALAAIICLSVPGHAATLLSVTGDVSINSGAGFKPATSGSEAQVGDVVMASPGARAQLVYPDKCTVPVNPGAVMTVQAESPCAGAYAQVNEVCLPGDLRWECNAGRYIVMLGAAAGVAVAVYYVTQDDDDDPLPASP